MEHFIFGAWIPVVVLRFVFEDAPGSVPFVIVVYAKMF
jgi:hypothetical protein